MKASGGRSVKAEVHLPFLMHFWVGWGNRYSELKVGITFSEGFVTETEKFLDLTKMLALLYGIIFTLEFIFSEINNSGIGKDLCLGTFVQK